MAAVDKATGCKLFGLFYGSIGYTSTLDPLHNIVAAFPGGRDFTLYALGEKIFVLKNKFIVSAKIKTVTNLPLNNTRVYDQDKISNIAITANGQHVITTSGWQYKVANIESFNQSKRATDLMIESVGMGPEHNRGIWDQVIVNPVIKNRFYLMSQLNHVLMMTITKVDGMFQMNEERIFCTRRIICMTPFNDEDDRLLVGSPLGVISLCSSKGVYEKGQTFENQDPVYKNRKVLSICHVKCRSYVISYETSSKTVQCAVMTLNCNADGLYTATFTPLELSKMRNPPSANGGYKVTALLGFMSLLYHKDSLIGHVLTSDPTNGSVEVSAPIRLAERGKTHLQLGCSFMKQSLNGKEVSLLNIFSYNGHFTTLLVSTNSKMEEYLEELNQRHRELAEEVTVIRGKLENATNNVDRLTIQVQELQAELKTVSRELSVLKAAKEQ